MTAATWSACSNKEELAITEDPTQSRTYTVTTTLSPKSGAQTRSTMTDNGDGSISAAWQVGDQILVGYYKGGSDYVNTTAEVTAVDGAGKATISVSLTDPTNGGYIMYKYPISFYDGSKDVAKDQTGTLDDVNANFAAIEGDGWINVSDSDVTLSSVTMYPQMCIWKFSFKDGSDNDITSAITKLVIDFPDTYYPQTYTVTPSSQSSIYVALRGNVTAKPICITAQTATGVYRKTAASVTLAAGKTYTTTGLPMKKAEVGKLFGADGNIYDDAAAATTAGTTAVAMIAYVGSESDCTNGLAIALEDVSTYALSWDDSHEYNYYRTAAEWCDLWNATTEKPVTGATWRLPSIKDWQYMLIGCGASGSYSDNPTSLSYSGLASKLSTAGGMDLDDDFFWSSTEVNPTDTAWCLVFYSGDASFKGEKETVTCSVRACLAF